MELMYKVSLVGLWFILFLYVFFACIDFGTAFFAVYVREQQKKYNRILTYLEDFLSPLWEATNILFIFFIIGIIALYPAIAYYYSIAFFIPGCIVVVLFVVRAIYFVVMAKEEEKITQISMTYALTGLAIPVFLSTGLIISEGGFLIEKNEEVIFLWKNLLLSPYAWSVWFYVITSVMFISSVFLCTIAYNTKDEKSFPLLRLFTLFWGAILAFANMLVFQALKAHNFEHFLRLINLEWLIVLSIFCYLLAILFVFQKKFITFAFIMTCFYLLFAFFAYGISHLPSILEPFVRFEQMNPNTQISISAILIFICGMMLLIPSTMVYLKRHRERER